MSTFEFHDEYREIEVRDTSGACHTFEVLVGDIEALSAGAELAERLKTVDPTALDAMAYRRLASEITTTIDQVLGEGSVDKVLAGRRPTITGLVQLMMFVLKEATDDFNGAVKNLLEDFSATVAEE
jgi:hypothetical protein